MASPALPVTMVEGLLRHQGRCIHLPQMARVAGKCRRDT
jgi:hypothetical protein